MSIFVFLSVSLSCSLDGNDIFRKKYVELEVSVIGLHTNVICFVWHKDTHVNLIVNFFSSMCHINCVFSLGIEWYEIFIKIFLRYFVWMSKNINFAKQQATITIYQHCHIITYVCIAHLQVAYVLQPKLGFEA